MSETVHVGCCVLCHVFRSLTSNVVLGMDWLHTFNPLIDLNAYTPSLECRGEILHILCTKYGCFYASVEVYALKLVLNTMHSDKVSA